MDSEVKKVLFSDCLDEYLEWAQVNKALNTYAMNRFYADRLREAFTSYLSTLTTKQVENYKVKRRASVSPATVNRELALLKHLCTKAGEPYDEVKRSFNTACRKAGIKDFHFHDLRHTFASHLNMNGVDLKTVMRLLGHKDIRMTLRYAHLSGEQLQAAVGTLDSGLKKGTKREQGTNLYLVPCSKCLI